MSQPETIVVIGAGVIGMATALLIQQHLKSGKSVMLVAREFPSDLSINYASPWAGAHFRPVPGTSPQALRESSQAQRTYSHMKRVAADPAAGVKFVQGIEHLEAPPPEYLDEQGINNAYSFLDKFRVLSSKELPADVKWGVHYTTFVTNTPVYLAYMLRKFIFRGGSTQKYALANVNEAFTLAPNINTVVNCSGVVFEDPKSFIIRGQTCVVRNPVSETITRQNSDGSWSFCIPRPLEGGTIIGGTKQPHDWDPNPSIDTRNSLLFNAAQWFPFNPESDGQFDIVRDVVGQRPAREGGMRIEVEKLVNDKHIVHAYGAGGRGIEISRGVAEDVTILMLENGLLHEKAAL